MANAPYLLDNSDIALIKDALDRDMLSREREIELAIAWRDHQDQAALNELILAYSKVVVRYARYFSRFGSPFQDLMQEGHIGLLKAARNFDVEQGCRFGTFAQHFVRSAMQEFVMRTWSTMKTAHSALAKSLFFQNQNIRRNAINGLREAGIENPGEDEIIERIAFDLDAPLDSVRSFLDLMRNPVSSLNIVMGSENGGEDEVMTMIVDEDAEPIDDEVISRLDMGAAGAKLREAMKKLNPREQDIISRRYLKPDPETLNDISQVYGISRERIRQIEVRALSKLGNMIGPEVATIFS